jgi:hypothetical protein
MCCFSRPVDLVADTNIFARASKEGRQFLVYAMRFKAGEELAMILPIPVPKKSEDDAVDFLDLKKYPDFFIDLRAGFPVPKSKNGRRPVTGGLKKDAPKLKVVEVGNFVASFVPSIPDFARLDERFRLPTKVWDKLPQYKDWGFAVFQLKKSETGELMKAHPMAFEFPRADKRQLFFPTVHIHDGTVPEKAGFDHMLFCQGEEAAMMRWEESPQPAEAFMKNLKEAKGIIDPKAHCYRIIMKGRYENKDVMV